ncbi:hypothetical protein SAMN05216276_111711 [Streptosporangium subroseum]|uniref:Uncharacterized protein n=1 Tax=Streptosporangium subroseum TaxID=106412 RepID=A0A239PCP4_9ACTN|nr:hypothetical protein SAMN05216276_111711 [Streptosporangium subroseum]
MRTRGESIAHSDLERSTLIPVVRSREEKLPRRETTRDGKIRQGRSAMLRP